MTGGGGQRTVGWEEPRRTVIILVKALLETRTVTTHRYSDTEVLPAVLPDEGEHKEGSAMEVTLSKYEPCYRYNVMV